MFSEVGSAPSAVSRLTARPVFSGDAGTQDLRNGAGLQEVRRVSEAIGGSCAISMLPVEEGLYCPSTHKAGGPDPLQGNFTIPSLLCLMLLRDLRSCQSDVQCVDWWTRERWSLPSLVSFPDTFLVLSHKDLIFVLTRFNLDAPGRPPPLRGYRNRNKSLVLLASRCKIRKHTGRKNETVTYSSVFRLNWSFT